MSLINSAIQRRFIHFMGGVVIQPISPFTVYRLDWVPADKEITKYRRGWNPFSERSPLIQSVDIHAEDQLSVGSFLFSQILETNYGNTLSFPTNAKNGPVHTYALHPLITLAYEFDQPCGARSVHLHDLALADGFSVGNSGNGGQRTNDTAMGDFSPIAKYRPIAQDPDNSRPSIRFGELGFTEVVDFRKHDNSVCINGGVYSPYSPPGGNNRLTTCIEDVINTRLMFEHSFDNKQDLASNHRPPYGSYGC